MDSSHKRPSETQEEASKRAKTDTEANDDLRFLKSSIKAEISGEFAQRFSTLENNLKSLQGKYDDLKKQIDSLKSSSSAVVSAAEKPIARPVLAKDPPPLPARETADIKPKHTFGGTSFNIKPMATPLPSAASIASPEQKLDSPFKSKNSPKPAFGASTSFGNNSAFEAAKKKNVFDGLPSQKESPATATPTSSFGSNSKFTNAFQNSLKKKSFLDEEATDASPGKESDVPSYKQISLTKVDNKTGEEDETSYFSTTCKLFELNLSQISEGWKERGLGPIHLNQSVNDSSQIRLVMRSHGLLRVILNNKITVDTKLMKGLEASLTPGKYLRFNSVNEKGLPIQYLLKFSNQATRDELIDKIETLKDTLRDNDATDTAATTPRDDKKPNGVKWM